MNVRTLSTILAATTGLALVAAAPAQAACPERIDLLKQFVESGTFDEATKAEVDQLALEAVESEQACERTVAELERRLNVEVREDEVVRLTGGTQGAGGSTQQSGSTQGTQQQGGSTQSATGASGQGGTQQAAAGGGGEQETTIGGGLDMPRDQIDSKYGPLAWMTFDEVIGAEVIDAEGDVVGEIVGLVRERPMGDFFAVVDVGAGDGAVVPINQFEIAD
jgi:hypothetical protein